ncbi:MAG: ATP-binding protein [Nitrospirales bacterium]
MPQETASLTMPGRVDAVPPIRHWLEGVLAGWSVSAQAISDLSVAVTEICTNVARYGYGDSGKEEIALRVTKAGTTVTVMIEDAADSSLPPRLPSLPDEPMAEGGYGQFLIQALVDEVSHRRLRPRGNRITLVKFDHPAAPAPSPSTPS